MMMIPNLFKQRMQQMLDEEYPAFEEACGRNRIRRLESIRSK